jgi:hypothetical protein
MRESNAPGPEMAASSALLDVLLFAPRAMDYLWVSGALVLAGLVVVVVRHRRQLWLPIAFLVVGALYYLNAAVDTEATRALTWPWYNNAPRLAALVVVPAAVLATATLAAATAGLQRLVARWRPLGATAATAAVAAAYLLVSLGGSTPAHQKLLEPFFKEKADYAWADRSELAALREIGRQLPSDAVVAANPYNGGSYLYLASGRRVLYTSEKTMSDGDLRLIGRRADDIGSDPEVCAAMRRQGVTHVLTGGTTSTFGPNRDRRYAGLAGVSLSPDFEYVTQAGPFRLFRVVGCAEG